MTRILLGDFGAVVRLGFEEALHIDGVKVIESSDEELCERVMAALPDVVLLDLDRPDASALASELVTAFPAIKVIACSSAEPTMRVFLPFHGGESYQVDLSLEDLAAAVRA